MICQLCGQQGAVTQTKYQGGKGEVDVILCEDRVTCWQRKDSQFDDRIVRSDCPICGRSFPHKTEAPVICCGHDKCLTEADRRGLL